MAAQTSWREFWSRHDTGIYVNRRNLEAHFASIADGLSPHLPRGGVVLDYGCGDALAADVMAAHCDQVLLYDAAPAVQARLKARFAAHPRIRVLDDAELAALPPAGIHLITVVSVLQYIDREALTALLERWRNLLRPGDGRLIIADVVAPDIPLLRDVASQLTFAQRNGFLAAALLGVVKLALSDYRRIRKTAGFTTYTADAMLNLLESAGLRAARLSPNIGPTPHRMSFVGQVAVTGGPHQSDTAAKVQ